MSYNYNIHKTIFERIHASDFPNCSFFPELENDKTKRSDKLWFDAATPQALVKNICHLDTNGGQADRIASVAEKLLAQKPQEIELQNLLKFIVTENLEKHTTWIALSEKRARVTAIKQLYDKVYPSPTTRPTTPPRSPTTLPKLFNFDDSFHEIFTLIHNDIFSDCTDKSWFDAGDSTTLIRKIQLLNSRGSPAEKTAKFTRALLKADPRQTKLREVLEFCVQRLAHKEFEALQKESTLLEEIRAGYSTFLLSKKPRTTTKATTTTVTTVPRGGLLNLGSTCWMNSLLRGFVSCSLFDCLLRNTVHNCLSQAEKAAFTDLQQKLAVAVNDLTTNDAITDAKLDALADAFETAFSFLQQDFRYTRGDVLDTQQVFDTLNSRFGPLPEFTTKEICYFSNGFHEEASTPHEESSAFIPVNATQENVTLSQILASSVFQNRLSAQGRYFFLTDSNGAVVVHKPLVNFVQDLLLATTPLLTPEEALKIASNEMSGRSLAQIINPYEAKILEKYPTGLNPQDVTFSSKKTAFTVLPRTVRVNINRTNQENPGADRVQACNVYNVSIDEELNLGQYKETPQTASFKAKVIFLRSGEHVNGSGGHHYCAARNNTTWTLYNDSAAPKQYSSFSELCSHEAISRDAQSVVYSQD